MQLRYEGKKTHFFFRHWERKHTQKNDSPRKAVLIEMLQLLGEGKKKKDGEDRSNTFFL